MLYAGDRPRAYPASCAHRAAPRVEQLLLPHKWPTVPQPISSADRPDDQPAFNRLGDRVCGKTALSSLVWLERGLHE